MLLFSQAKEVRRVEAKTRPELRFVTKVHETSDIDEAGRYAEPGWLGHHCGGQGEERIPILPGIPGDQSQPYFGVATGKLTVIIFRIIGIERAIPSQ